MKKKRYFLIVFCVTMMFGAVIAHASCSGTVIKKITLADGVNQGDAAFYAYCSKTDLLGFARTTGKFYFSDEYDANGNFKSSLNNHPLCDQITLTEPLCKTTSVRTGKVIASKQFKRTGYNKNMRFFNESKSVYVPYGVITSIEWKDTYGNKHTESVMTYQL